MKSPQDRPPRPWRRRFARAAIAIGALAALVAIAVVVILANLDRPWMKARIRRLVRESAGIELDYRALKLRPFSGLWLDGLVIATPEPLRALAPDLARVDHLEAVWSLSSLLGRGPKIRAAAVGGVSVVIAQDAAGRTSLDLLGGPPAKPEKPKPPAPLSHLAAQIFSGAAPVGHLDVTGVSASFVRAQADGAVQRDAIGGLRLELSTHAAPGGWAAVVRAGAPDAPLAVDVSRQGPARGAARLWLAIGLNGDAQGFSLATDLRVGAQDLVPVRVAELLHLDAAVKPDPVRGRTTLQVDRLAAADGAVVLSLRAEVADGAARLSLASADGQVDLARLLGVLPPGTLPVALQGGRVQLHLAGIELAGGAPRLGAGSLARLDIDVPRARASASQPAVALAGLHLAVAADGAADGRWNGQVALRVASVELAGPTRLSVRGVRLETRARDVRIDAPSPAASTGTFSLAGDVAALDARTPGLRALAEQLRVRLATSLSGRPPYTLELQVPVDGLRLFDGRGHRLFDAPARIDVSLAHVHPDARHPTASRGDARAELALGDLQAIVDAHKRADDVDLDLTLKAPSLAAARPFLPPGLAGKLDWGRLSVELETKARLARLNGAAPTLRQETSLRVQGLRAGRSGVRQLVLSIRSNGDARRHDADVSLAAQGVSVEGHAAPDAQLHLTAQVDRGQPSAKLHVEGQGAARLALDAAVGFAAGPRRLEGDLDLKADRLLLAGVLRPFVPALDGVDLRRAAVGLHAHAALTGLVEHVGRGGEVRMARDPLRTAAGSVDLSVHVADLGVTRGATQVTLGAVDWRAGLRAAGARRDLSSELRLDQVRLASGEQRIDVARLEDTAAAALIGDPVTGRAELTNRLLLAGLGQDLVPFGPTDEIALQLAAHRQPDGMIDISELRLTDAQAGTALSLSGAVALGADRRLSLRGRFDQDLAKLKRLPSRMTASGHLGLAFGVESADLEMFRTRAGLELDDVNLRVPDAGLAVETADAKIPIDVRVALGPDGITIPRDVHPNPYASLRFADQAPLQAHSSFLSIARLTTPVVTVAPLAGNLSIDQNVLSLGQLEMGVRGGRVTGRCVLDWQDDDIKVETHVRASGVLSSHGEPFDGDAALVVSTGERTIEGRAQILRIGRRHLLDLLDMQDPHRVDPAMNRIRHALLLGYPDQVRIAFNHGFASARVTLGGLARLIRIDEIRGIPTGSLLDKVLSSPAKSETE